MANISGEQKTWHKVTLDFVASRSFSEEPSTFRDYRLDVTFTNADTGEVITVPGYFAADGNAANTNATSGNIWRVNFNPPSDGDWTYEASFRTGKDIAAKSYAEAPNAGTPVGFINGDSGTIQVSETDKTGDDFRAKGMIVQDEGTHYLQHQGDGDYFVRGGPGIPENFLANKDFDNTANGRHDYSTHLQNFNNGDPTWDGGKGKAVIGATNYIAEQGLNSIYVLTNTSGGDGQDVSPWTFAAQNTPKNDGGISPGEVAKFSTYDVSKLSQWEIVFDHMDEKGIYKNVLFQETENDQQLNGGTNASGTTLSVERLVYIREMIARFGHNNGIQWNLGEENTNTDQQREDMAEYVKSVDAYDHLVVIHSFPGQINQVYDPLLNDEEFDGTSLQTNAQNVRNRIIEFRDKSEASGDPWVLAWDEDSGSNGIIDPYSNNPDSNNEQILRKGFWGMLTAGGSGGNWYFKGSSGHSLDQNYDTFDAHSSVWKWTSAALDFFNNRIPFWDMRQADGLTPDNDDYVMAKDGEYYVIYLPSGEANNVRLNLNGQGGEQFNVFWYNPRTGGELIADGQVSGGGQVNLGNAPSEVGKDWVVLVRNTKSPEFPTPDGSANPNPNPNPNPSPNPNNQAPIAEDDTASTGQNQTIVVDVLKNDSDPEGGSLTLTDVQYGGNTSQVSIEGNKIKVNPLSSATNDRTETITYTVRDAQGKTDTAELKVNIGNGGGGTPPPNPNPNPNPQPPASGDGYFKMTGNRVVMQAEDGQFVFPGNGNNTKWQLTNQFGGSKGDGALLWTGPDLFGGNNAGQPQTAPLTYDFEVTSPGTYYISLRATRPDTGEPGDRNNDFFVQFEDTGFKKVFFGGARNQYNWGTTYDVNHQKSPSTFNVTQAMIDANDGIFTLTIAARSRQAALDEIHIQKGSFSRDNNAPTSQFVDGGAPSPNPNPPPDPNPNPGPNNEAPVARDDTADTGHNNTILVDVLANDSDPEGGALTLTDVQYNGNTSLVSIEGNKIKVNPLSAATNDRTETITYTVRDAQGKTDTATLKVNVGQAGGGNPPPPPPPQPPVNKAPVAADDAVSTGHNKTVVVDVLANDSDPEGGALTIKDVLYEGNTALVSVEDGKIKVNPLKSATESRVETVTYTVEDEQGNTDTATLAVTVGGGSPKPPPNEPPANQAPVAVDDAVNTPHNKTVVVDVLANDSDPEGGGLTLTDVSYEGDTSLVSIEDGKIKVNPLAAAKSARVETITYTVEDGEGAASTGTLKVNVGGGGAPTPPPPPANQAPVAADDVIATSHNKTVVVDVLKNDSDPDGDGLTLKEIVYDGNTALVSIEDGKIKVNPLSAAKSARTETVTYTVEDQDGATDTATLKVNVGGASSGPAPNPDPNPGPAPTPPSDGPVTRGDAADAGISQRALTYLYNQIDADQRKAVVESDAFQNTIRALQQSDKAPADAIVITNASQASLNQIENGAGKTFLIKGNLNFGQTIDVPSNVTIYVDGKLTMNGSHAPKFYDDENKGDSVDAVFRVDNASNVKLIGIDNAELVGNYRSTGVYIEGSKNVEVRGFEVRDVWEGIVAHWGSEDVTIMNNYVHDVGKRGLWSLGADRTEMAHNFVENTGGDGIDFDAYVDDNVAFENVIVGWRRWAGFVEEGAQGSQFVKNVAVMAEFEYRHPEPGVIPDNRFMMGFADNGTSVNINRKTADNYFIQNELWRPENGAFDRDKAGGDYFANRNAGDKGTTYFWDNGGNVGYTNGNHPRNFADNQENRSDLWHAAQLDLSGTKGNGIVAALENKFAVGGQPAQANKSASPLDMADDSLLDLFIADAGTNQTLRTLEDGDRIAVADLGDDFTFYAEANGSGAKIASVELAFNGDVSVEKIAPYALFGDVSGDFRKGLDLNPGTYEIELRAFGENNTLLETSNVSFELV